MMCCLVKTLMITSMVNDEDEIMVKAMTTPNDALMGEQGNDWLDGGTNNGILMSGTGNNTLLGILGSDEC